MDDPLPMGVFQRLAHFAPDVERLLEAQSSFLALLQEVRNRPALHILADDVRLSFFLADIVDRDDIRVIPESPHRHRLALQPADAYLVQSFGLDQADRGVAIELAVMDQKDLLHAPFAQEAFDLIASLSE